MGTSDDEDLRPTAFDIETFELVLILLLLDACDEGEGGVHSSSSISAAEAAAFFTFLGLDVVNDDDVLDWQVI